MIFSKNPHSRARQIFDLIAPIYSGLDSYVRRGMRGAMRSVDEAIGLAGKSVLDLGTGPGAWAALYKEFGAGQVHGVDFAPRMVRFASRRYSPDISFSLGDATRLSDFSDGSFDVVTASLMLHGVTSDVRAQMLREMHRVSRRYLVINDFYGPTPAFVRFLEYLERSDYVHFKANFCDELRAFFPKVERLGAKYGTSVYVAYK